MTDPDPSPSIPQLLLELQTVDTEVDQLGHRRANSPRHQEMAAASTALRDWEQQRARFRERIDELGASIERAEERGAELTTHRQRLEQQLRTVIAPREAEALMHEIETIRTEADQLDIQELEALEEQATLDDRLAAHLQTQDAVAATVRLADGALSAEVSDIDVEVAALTARRGDLRGQLPDSLLSTYDRKRAALGVAVAALQGRQCLGCHLELSPAEIDTVKDDAAATGVTDCPDCGRLLIV